MSLQRAWPAAPYIRSMILDVDNSSMLWSPYISNQPICVHVPHAKSWPADNPRCLQTYRRRPIQSVLRARWLPSDAFHDVARATTTARLLYAAPAWWGLTKAEDRPERERFHYKTQNMGFLPPSLLGVATLVEDMDGWLLRAVMLHHAHVLDGLSPHPHGQSTVQTIIEPFRNNPECFPAHRSDIHLKSYDGGTLKQNQTITHVYNSCSNESLFQRSISF